MSCFIDCLKFWRTIQKNEIDFVVGEKDALEVKIDPRKFKEKSYKIFFKNYPNINLSVVSLNAKDKVIGNHKILEVWQI